MRTWKDDERCKLRMTMIPNIDIPLTLLADLGNVNKGTLRNLAFTGKINTYKSKSATVMVSEREMARLKEIGLIELTDKAG